VSFFLGELVPHNERVVGKTHGMELENVFQEPSVLGSPLSNCIDSSKIIIISLEVDVPLSVLKTT